MATNSKDQMRANMIEQQIRPWNVLNQRVLNVFDMVNRDEFVSDEHKAIAFSEVRIPLNAQDRMLFPALEGRILQEIAIQPQDKVLVIGTGSGFLTALASKLGENITAIDMNGDYTVNAKINAERLGLDNITFITADLKDFAVEKNSYDVIVMTGSVLEVPQKLLDGLTDTGRLLAFVGHRDQTVTSGTLYQNQLGELREASLFEVELERLSGFEDQPQFVF